MSLPRRRGCEGGRTGHSDHRTRRTRSRCTESYVCILQQATKRAFIMIRGSCPPFPLHGLPFCDFLDSLLNVSALPPNTACVLLGQVQDRRHLPLGYLQWLPCFGLLLPRCSELRSGLPLAAHLLLDLGKSLGRARDENVCRRKEAVLHFLTLFLTFQSADLLVAQPAAPCLRRTHPSGEARQRHGHLRLRRRVPACELRTNFPEIRQVS